MLELAVIAPIAAIVCFAAFTQGVVGFGFGMVSMGLLPLVLPELVAIPFVAVFALSVALMIALQVREHIALDRVLPPLVGVLAGVPLGLVFLSEADPRYVRLSLGVFLVAFASWSILGRVKRRSRPIGDGWGYVAGFVSGVLGGAFNTGGPPLVVYAALKWWGKDATQSTLQVLFALTGVVSVSGHILAGRLTGEIAAANLVVAPAIVLGVWIGGRLYRRVDQATYRLALLLLLMVVGVVFISKSIGTSAPVPTHVVLGG